MPLSKKTFEVLAQAEGPFVRLINLAAALFECRAAVLTLLSADTAVVRLGGQPGVRRIALEKSLAPIMTDLGPDEVLIVPDLQQDERFAGHPLMCREGASRCLVAAMVRGVHGEAAGSLCLLFEEPNTPFTQAQAGILRQLARMGDDVLAGVEAARSRDEQMSSLELVGQMSGVGHWRMERDANQRHWGDAIYNLYGLNHSQTIPNLDHSWRFAHEDGKQALKDLMDTAFETGEGYVTTLTLKNQAGDIRKVQTSASTQKDETGEVTALFGVFQDITEQDRLLVTARNNESRYRLLAENVGDALTRVKMDGTSKYISPAIQNIIGWTYEEMSGLVLDYVYPDDRAFVIDCIREAVATGEPVMREFRALHRDGRTVWVECTFRAVHGETEVKDDVIVVIRDVSQRKALEEEVIEAKERAEQAAAAKSEFLANMSHELRTPLTSVVGFSGLLRKSEALPDKERLYAERISTASEALLEVINDILDYSKLEAEATELDSISFDPRALVEEAAAFVEPQCQVKGLALKVEIGAQLPGALVGDAGRLRQVMLNLLSNAVKFTSRGSVTVKASGQALKDGRWGLRLEVQDTGIGIAADKLPQLFDRFTQADASTTRLYGGTGLGLAISQRLIRMMEGDIAVQSQPGQGTSFSFEVPLDVGQGEAVQEAKPGRERVGDLIKAKILVADDAPANRELVTAILGAMGMEVHTVQDGAQAVQAMREDRYDLVLMDVHMPVVDGLEATQEIRRMQPLGQGRTPILALTANVQADQVARCLEAGMDGHLSKPILMGEMVKALSKWLAVGARQEVLEEA